MTTKKSRRWFDLYDQGHQRPCSDRVENLTFPLYRPSFLFYLVCTPCTPMFVLDDKQVCDGKVLALYSIDDIDYTEQISEKLNFCMNKKIVVIYSRKQMSLQDKLLEYEVLQEIKGDTLFFTSEENKVLLKEIPIIEDDLYREIYLYLDTAFEDRDERTIFYALTDHVEVDNKKRISDVVDAVCSQVYSGTLSVNNELINKENITTVPIKKLEKQLLIV